MLRPRHLFSLLTTGLLLPTLVRSQETTGQAATDLVTSGLEQTRGASGFGNSFDITTILGGILNGLFGFLGVLAMLFILWGGWDWMNAKGDPGAIGKAKGKIQNAIVGLVIIVMSYAIVNFLVGLLAVV